MRRLRDIAVALGVSASVVLGGGSAWAARTDGNGPASATHGISYSLLSFRAIALSSTAPVAFGNIRQGHLATLDGPDIRYGTTWTNDRIYATIDEPYPVSLQGIDLFVRVYDVAPPNQAEGCDTLAGFEGTAALVPIAVVRAAPDLTSDQNLVTGITDCGAGSNNPQFDAHASTEITVDATGADLDIDYSLPVTTQITYTIDFGQ